MKYHLPKAVAIIIPHIKTLKPIQLKSETRCPGRKQFYKPRVYLSTSFLLINKTSEN